MDIPLARTGVQTAATAIDARTAHPIPLYPASGEADHCVGARRGLKATLAPVIA